MMSCGRILPCTPEICWELCLDKHGDDLVAIDFGGARSPVPSPRSRMLLLDEEGA